MSEIADCVNNTAYHCENLEFKESSKLSYVTRTANQNGLYGFVEAIESYNISPSNTISFGGKTAEFFTDRAITSLAIKCIASSFPS